MSPPHPHPATWMKSNRVTYIICRLHKIVKYVHVKMSGPTNLCLTQCDSYPHILSVSSCRCPLHNWGPSPLWNFSLAAFIPSFFPFQQESPSPYETFMCWVLEHELWRASGAESSSGTAHVAANTSRSGKCKWPYCHSTADGPHSTEWQCSISRVTVPELQPRSLLAASCNMNEFMECGLSSLVQSTRPILVIDQAEVLEKEKNVVM